MNRDRTRVALDRMVLLLPLLAFHLLYLLFPLSFALLPFPVYDLLLPLSLDHLALPGVSFALSIQRLR